MHNANPQCPHLPLTPRLLPHKCSMLIPNLPKTPTITSHISVSPLHSLYNTKQKVPTEAEAHYLTCRVVTSEPVRSVSVRVLRTSACSFSEFTCHQRNSFLDLYHARFHQQLGPCQRVAVLATWDDGEVNTGGRADGWLKHWTICRGWRKHGSVSRNSEIVECDRVHGASGVFRYLGFFGGGCYLQWWMEMRGVGGYSGKEGALHCLRKGSLHRSSIILDGYRMFT